MKNKFWPIFVGSFLALVIIAGTARLMVTAQQSAPERSLTGTWITTITQRDCQTGAPTRTFQGVLTFNMGGTMVGDSTVSGAALKTASYGIWQRENGWQEYSFSFMLYRFNPDGSLAGSQKVRQSVTLSPSGNDFTTTGALQVLDANANPIGSGCATSTGVRFQ